MQETVNNDLLALALKEDSCLYFSIHKALKEQQCGIEYINQFLYDKSQKASAACTHLIQTLTNYYILYLKNIHNFDKETQKEVQVHGKNFISKSNFKKIFNFLFQLLSQNNDSKFPDFTCLYSFFFPYFYLESKNKLRFTTPLFINEAGKLDIQDNTNFSQQCLDIVKELGKLADIPSYPYAIIYLINPHFKKICTAPFPVSHIYDLTKITGDFTKKIKSFYKIKDFNLLATVNPSVLEKRFLMNDILFPKLLDALFYIILLHLLPIEHFIQIIKKLNIDSTDDREKKNYLCSRSIVNIVRQMLFLGLLPFKGEILLSSDKDPIKKLIQRMESTLYKFVQIKCSLYQSMLRISKNIIPIKIKVNNITASFIIPIYFYKIFANYYNLTHQFEKTLALTQSFVIDITKKRFSRELDEIRACLEYFLSPMLYILNHKKFSLNKIIPLYRSNQIDFRILLAAIYRQGYDLRRLTALKYLDTPSTFITRNQEKFSFLLKTIAPKIWAFLIENILLHSPTAFSIKSEIAEKVKNFIYQNPEYHTFWYLIQFFETFTDPGKFSISPDLLVSKIGFNLFKDLYIIIKKSLQDLHLELENISLKASDNKIKDFFMQLEQNIFIKILESLQKYPLIKKRDCFDIYYDMLQLLAIELSAICIQKSKFHSFAAQNYGIFTGKLKIHEPKIFRRSSKPLKYINAFKA